MLDGELGEIRVRQVRPRRRRWAAVGAIDAETDPFERGVEIAPFVWGVTIDWPAGREHVTFWGDDCTEKMVAWLRAQPGPLLLYAHNGGRFDFLFMLREIGADPMIINGRLVCVTLGEHELRDSWAILPVALGQAGDKGEIDYRLMRRVFRNRPPVRRKILDYLRQDCEVLLDAVLAYRERFGNKVTMASAAIRELDLSVERETGEPAVYTLYRMHPDQDAEFRRFYFGGRVECFERGALSDDFVVVDANSLYPSVMLAREHPTGRDFLRQETIDDRTDFAIVDADSRGAFPLRAEDGSLAFPHARAVFRVTGHELRAAMELGLADVRRLLWAAWCPVRTSFASFVREFYDLRLAAADAGDEVGKLHYKLVLNSCYGRFALNADRIMEWCIASIGATPGPDEIDQVTGEPVYWRAWEPAYLGQDVCFWRRDADPDTRRRALRNVATGASIAGAARAELLRAIAQAERPVYCDTDGLICRRAAVQIGPDLGQWKVEAEGTHAFIAAKKLYCLADARRGATREEMAADRFVMVDGRTVPVVKLASKGVRLTGQEIARAARGDSVTWQAERPTISVAGVQTYMKREVRAR